MGASAKKTHQAFAISPAATTPPPGLTAAILEEPIVELDHDVDASPVPKVAGRNVAGELGDLEEPATGHATDDALADGGPVTEVGPGRWGEALIAVPDLAPLGAPNGTALLVGGADLDESLATLFAYQHPVTGDPVEVLHATVDPAAEAKLLDALSLSDQQLVAVETATTLNGRTPLDITEGFAEKLTVAAKSINHHLKDATPIPAHTTSAVTNLQTTLTALAATTSAATDVEMLDHYQTICSELAARCDPAWATGYTAGGKTGPVTAFEVHGPATITSWVPAPLDEPAPGKLATGLRNATRPAPTLTAAGVSVWDGTTRTTSTGKEYVIDLGDGYQAIYRPHQTSSSADAVDYTLRGQLELHAPTGGMVGHGPELVNRLGQLNLVNRAMTAGEGEWTYLRRNIIAQDLQQHSAVAAAVAAADGLDDAAEQGLFTERAHQAAGMNDRQLHRFARQLRLDAETVALPAKVKLVRQAVATATGFASGDALASSAGYQPTPTVSHGWLTWSRFDVTAIPATVTGACGGKVLYHRVTASNLATILATGSLVSTERRHLMGTAHGLGMSEAADKKSGGATSVFLRLGKPAGGPALVWDNPAGMLSRADWYGYNGDHYGALNPTHNTTGLTRDPATVAAFTATNNEIMFRHGIDLLHGPHPPTRIITASPKERTSLLDQLAANGVTHIGSRPVKDVITC